MWWVSFDWVIDMICFQHWERGEDVQWNTSSRLTVYVYFFLQNLSWNAYCTAWGAVDFRGSNVLGRHYVCGCTRLMTLMLALLETKTESTTLKTQRNENIYLCLFLASRLFTRQWPFSIVITVILNVSTKESANCILAEAEGKIDRPLLVLWARLAVLPACFLRYGC